MLSYVQCILNVPPSWSFVNGLLNYVIKELNVEEVLKSPIFVVQNAAAPKNGVEFRQGSNGSIRSSLATSCDVSRRRARSPNFDQSEALKLSQTDTHTHRYTENQHTVRPCSTSSACKKDMSCIVYSFPFFFLIYQDPLSA